jgi:hypothetical protein
MTMKSTLYRISLVILTLVITVVFGLDSVALAAKKPATKKAHPKKPHATIVQDDTLALSNDYVVLAKAAPKKAAPKKKK